MSPITLRGRSPEGELPISVKESQPATSDLTSGFNGYVLS
jgi:hypothetical protein